VENTQARLFRKLGVRNRMETLSTADALGLIDRAVVPVGQAPPGQAPPGQENGRPVCLDPVMKQT